YTAATSARNWSVVSGMSVLPRQICWYSVGPHFDWLPVLVGNRERQFDLVLALATRRRLSGKIEEGEQLETTTGLGLGTESDPELEIDPIRREDDVLILALKNGFPQLVAQLLDGVRKRYLHLWAPGFA